MNRHHPYGGYGERPTRGGRGGGNPSMRGRPPRSAGLSPPPSGYPSAQAAYRPGAPNMNDANNAAYQPQNAYAPSNEFSGGLDRHYPMSMSGGPPRGGMSARGGPPASRPPPPPPGGSMGSPPSYGYTPASYEPSPYNAPNPYEQSAMPPAPGQPPYGSAPAYDYNGAAGAPPGPPPAGYDGQVYGPTPSFGQPPYGSGPPPGSYDRPRPPPGDAPGFGERGRGRGRGSGRGGGRGGRGGGFGGGGGRFDDDEKPCRTLFVRSINFETDSEFVKQQFEKFGEIKTFFDMVEKRGIAFITYYDLRAARDAMLAMKGAPFGGRPINIHYSLPREEDKAQRCDRDKNQGTLFSVLKGANETLSDDAVHEVFSEFGDVKKVRDYPGQKNSRFVEYFDSRACQLAHDQLNGRPYLDGQWDLKFAWDVVTDEDLEWAKQSQQGAGSGLQAGSPPPPPQSSWGRPPPAGDRAPLPTDYPSYDAPGSSRSPSLGNGRAPIPATGAPVDNGWGRRAGSGSGPASKPDAAVAQPPAAGDANRLEQAQKVQQLLASLGAASKPPAAAAATSTPAAPSASSPPTQSPPPAGAPALPANIAALLQSAAGAPKPTGSPKPQSPPTSNASASGSGQDNGQQSMHQLLSMLNQNRPPRPS
ncbi:uncharacterized protein UBRO_12669 [Ustilago bromivora]|uniref:RRM domain-containing protein n=1 Tax=Ustilago bromivora TaxID=307758 RepID=A0A1K0FWE5_9BASI|nr:uncharacterized protein UBRO_12669 [Ustilago bromivora]SYW75321.1 uncharacterized protein UBRO2_00556 [Ustilago bromivora]